MQRRHVAEHWYPILRVGQIAESGRLVIGLVALVAACRWVSSAPGVCVGGRRGEGFEELAENGGLRAHVSGVVG
jgi:hypothetical protein